MKFISVFFKKIQVKPPNKTDKDKNEIVKKVVDKMFKQRPKQ